MPETVIGLFNQDQQAQEALPLLLGQGIDKKNIDLINKRAGGSDLIDKLSRLGVADAQLRQCYVEGVTRGGTLLAARAPDESKAEQAAAILRRHGASNCASSTAPQGQGVARLAVVEEELQVGKREVETGGVRVRREMTERPVEAQVNLREEHVKVERRPVDRPLTEADRAAALKGQTIEVTERSEQPVVQKADRVVEEVVVGKEAEERTETVRGAVRRSDVKVEKIDPQEKGRAS